MAIDPFTIGLAVGPQIISGALQWMNSEEAKAATAAERKYVQDLIDKVQAPNFKETDFTPQDYKVVGRLMPETAAYIREVNPTLVRGLGADAQTGRNAQRDALEQLLEEARGGDNPIFDAALSRAGMKAANQAKSARGTLDESFNRRGQLGSGFQYAGNLSAIGDALNAQSLMGTEAAAERARMAQDARKMAMDGGRQLAQDDISMEETNANVVNDFNSRIAKSQQDQLNLQADIRNKAQMENLANTQDVANKNTTGANKAQTDKIARDDMIAKEMAAAEQWKTNALVGQSGGRVGDIDANTQQTNKVIGGLGDAASVLGRQAASDTNPLEAERIRKKKEAEAAGRTVAGASASTAVRRI